MPKQKNVTREEIVKCIDAMDEPTQILAELSQRLTRGYHDELDKPMELVRALHSQSRVLMNAVATLMSVDSLQEMRREAETQRAELKRLQDEAEGK